MTQCKRCQHDLPKNAKICKHCGLESAQFVCDFTKQSLFLLFASRTEVSLFSQPPATIQSLAYEDGSGEKFIVEMNDGSNYFLKFEKNGKCLVVSNI